MPRTLLGLGAAVFVACFDSWPGPIDAPYRRTDDVRGAGALVGPETCADCHDSFEGHHASTAYHASCETCHGPGQLHSDTALAADIRFPDSDDCRACHDSSARSLLGWHTSEHARAGLLCSDCHDTHNRELLHVRATPPIQEAMLRRSGHVTRLCASCHQEVVARFDLPSHHPMREGMIACSDCHQPHDSGARRLGNSTDLCASCHQDVIGPWIYEHAPVTEDCGYCHVPHGASADDLLSTNQPAACIGCHSIPVQGGTHVPWAFTTRCTDCHNAVHGSHTDPHLRR
jgi:DmsE family decaheme c-type cytochrome